MSSLAVDRGFKLWRALCDFRFMCEIALKFTANITVNDVLMNSGIRWDDGDEYVKTKRKMKFLGQCLWMGIQIWNHKMSQTSFFFPIQLTTLIHEKVGAISYRTISGLKFKVSFIILHMDGVSKLSTFVCNVKKLASIYTDIHWFLE